MGKKVYLPVNKNEIVLLSCFVHIHKHTTLSEISQAQNDKKVTQNGSKSSVKKLKL